MPEYRYYVTVTLEADREAPIADIGYRGRDVASVEARADGLRVSLYEAEAVPLDGLIEALREAEDRLSPGAKPA